MANTTGIAVGCAVGIPGFVACIMAIYFFFRNRKKLEKEDLEYQRDDDVHNVNMDLDFDNLEQLKKEEGHGFDHSDASDDGKGSSEKSDETAVTSSQDKKQRYTPAYRKKMRSSMSNLSNSRSSSYSNLQPPPGSLTPQQQQNMGSNSSINSSKTNLTDHFYQNVPVLDNNESAVESSTNSIDLARSLHMPTPSYTRKPSINRPASTSSNFEEDYDLKNNYNMDNQDEIQEEDQYENEFTNYSENKRAFIEGLRPKRDQ